MVISAKMFAINSRAHVICRSSAQRAKQPARQSKGSTDRDSNSSLELGPERPLRRRTTQSGEPSMVISARGTAKDQETQDRPHKDTQSGAPSIVQRAKDQEKQGRALSVGLLEGRLPPG
jgi:hypothetical protein